MPKKILIIDDEVPAALLLCKLLNRNGFEAIAAFTVANGLEKIKNNDIDLVLCDYRLQNSNGGEVLACIKMYNPLLPVIIITGYPDVKLAVQLIKNGAYDYMVKPIDIPGAIATINKAIPDWLATEVPSQNASQQNFSGFNFIAGVSQPAMEMHKQIQLVAPTLCCVLITGESGTGKEGVARKIHLNSKRANAPFIAVDCGALTHDLAQSELFGHEKGAFTGALSSRKGYFEMANGGTLFLDEIGNMPYHLQMLLLRILQERKLKRIGAVKEISLDVRIIVATNANLKHDIQLGVFREDLYFRLNEFCITTAPLRYRTDDIELLADWFIREVNNDLGIKLQGFSSKALACLKAYAWPGNIRELRNVVRSAALLTQGDTIDLKTLPARLVAGFMMPAVKSQQVFTRVKAQKIADSLRESALPENFQHLLVVLEETGYNKTKTAAILNINRKTLYNRLRGVCA